MRERDRTLSVNSAFNTLRELIPTEPLDRKLSKIETLRLATSYIQHLAVQLHADCGSGVAPCHLIPSQGEKRKRQICTFCVAMVKRTKSEVGESKILYNCDNCDSCVEGLDSLNIHSCYKHGQGAGTGQPGYLDIKNYF